MISFDIKRIISEQEQRLSEHRFKHTRSVAETALKIAASNGIDDNELLQKIECAAWLHDVCKELHSDELIQLAEHYSIKIYPEDRENPNVLHARVGALYAKEFYEIFDPVILKAIEYHTLGGGDMDEVAKIIYLADMIEPRRDKKEKAAGKESYLDPVRELVFEQKDIDAALKLAMDKKIRHAEKKSKVHPMSLKSRELLFTK